jgi:opacity protein-like surface antigen
MKRTCLVAGVLAIASTGTFAQSSTYLVGGIGTAKVNSDIATYSQSSGGLTISERADPDGNVFGLLLGYNFDERWSLEAGYLNIRGLSANASLVATNAVVQGNTINGTLNARQDISGYALTLAPRFTHRVGPVDLFVKAGLAYVKVANEVTVGGSGTVNGNPVSGNFRQTFRDRSTVPMIGIGAQFFATRNIGVRGDYTYISKVGDRETTGESAVKLLMLSGIYQF